MGSSNENSGYGPVSNPWDRERVPGACPDCGSVSVARHGTGTEQLEGELEAIVEPLPVLPPPQADTNRAQATARATRLMSELLLRVSAGHTRRSWIPLGGSAPFRVNRELT